MFGTQKQIDTIAEDQAKVDGACGFIEDLMSKIDSAKSSTQSLMDDIEKKKTLYETHLMRLHQVHTFCSTLETAGTQK